MSLAGSVSDVSFLSKEWRPSSDAWSTFNDFRRQGIFCDVVLQAEGIRFPVHRLVLCACSNYFRALFLGGWKSSDRQEVEIPGISREILSCLLEFAYTGQVIITPYNVQELLPAADQFQVYYVKEKCCLYLKHHLSPTNCVGIWKYAQWFFCDNLRKAANDFMLRNFEDMSKTSQEFLKLSVEEVTNLISDDRLNVKVEDVVCEAIFRWVERSRKDRIAYLPRLLKNARLGLLNPEFFLKKVKENDLVREKIADCQTILNYAMTVVCDPGLNDADGAPPELMNLMRPRFPTAILLAVGGWSGGCATNAIEAYDTRSETWVNVSSMPGLPEESPRAYHGVAFINKCIYIIGGFDGDSYFKTVRRFSVVKNEWSEEPSMFHRRCYISVATMNGKIFALGGMDGESRLKSGEFYDPDLKAWSRIPDMNERRSDASATSLNNKVYVCGGFTGHECLFTAEFYDPAILHWTYITPMQSKRSGVTISAFNNMIYAVGGFDGRERLRTAEAYCPETNAWRWIAPMNKPRSNFGMNTVEDQLIAVGGFNGHQTSSDVEVYDATTNEWYDVSEIHIPRSALSCCVMENLPHAVLRKFCISREVCMSAEDDNFSESLLILPSQEASSNPSSDTVILQDEDMFEIGHADDGGDDR